MPLIYNSKNDEYQLGLWSITEPISELLNLYTPTQAELQTFHSITNETRKKEWLAVRALLTQISIQPPVITYEATGKPLLLNQNSGFSISHTSTMAGVILSKKAEVGIDIEKTDRNIDRVISRFLSEKERNWLQTDQNYLGIHLWCAKEAVFKAIDQSNVDFAKQIHLEATEETQTIKATYINADSTMTFKVYFIDIENHTIAWIA